MKTYAWFLVPTWERTVHQKLFVICSLGSHHRLPHLTGLGVPVPWCWTYWISTVERIIVSVQRSRRVGSWNILVGWGNTGMDLLFLRILHIYSFHDILCQSLLKTKYLLQEMPQVPSHVCYVRVSYNGNLEFWQIIQLCQLYYNKTLFPACRSSHTTVPDLLFPLWWAYSISSR